MNTGKLSRFQNAFLWAMCIACSLPQAWAATGVIDRFRDPQPIMIAHRGCWTITSENSLKGLKACAERGVDIVEVDVRATKDGQLVLMHDDTLDRMTNRSGRVEDMSASEFKSTRLRQGAGGEHAPITAEAPPTFVEELRAAKDHLVLYLDIKVPSTKERIYQTIEQEGAEDWVIFPVDTTELSTMPEWARRRTILNAVQCGVDGLTTGCFATLAEAVDAYRLLRPLAIGVFFKTDDFLKSNARAGIRLQVWTNAPMFAGGRDEANSSLQPGTVWADCLKRGLDVIATDNAVGLSDYLKSISAAKQGTR